MNRLKLKYPFCGYGELFGFWLVVGCITLLLILFVIGIEFQKSLAVTICIAAASIILFYCRVNRLSSEDREKISATEPLKWRILTMDEQDALMKSKQASWAATLLTLGYEFVIGVVLTMGTTKFDFHVVLLITFGVMFVTLIFHLVLKREERFWSALDESAECTKVTIEDNYNGYEHRRSGFFHVKYAVFYTPEGKYVVKLSDVMKFGNRLYIVRFRGRYTYIDFAQ